MIPTGELCVKDPAATGWPRGIDWTDYLAQIAEDEIIASSAWAITGSDDALTIDGETDQIVTGSKQTQVKLSGGTLGQIYTLTNTIATNGGTTDNRFIDILIEDL